MWQKGGRDWRKTGQNLALCAFLIWMWPFDYKKRWLVLVVFAGNLPDLPVSSSRRNSSPSSSSSSHLKCHQDQAAELEVWVAVEEEEVVEVVAVLLRILLDHLYCLESQMVAEEDTLAWPRPPPGWSILHSHRLARRFPSHASLPPTGFEGRVGTSKWVTESRSIIGGDGGGRTSPPRHPRLVKSQRSDGLKKNEQEIQLRVKTCFRGGSWGGCLH